MAVAGDVAIENCRVCGTPARPLFRGRVLDLEIQYFECPRCRYVQVEQPYWLDRAYNQAINDSDTGLVARNVANTRITIATLAALGALDGKVVDFAGGYGLLVRMLRDEGVDALWRDPYCENVVARGFEHPDGEPAALATAFEAFEHFVEPAVELRRMLEVAPNVLFSTMIMPTPAPAHDQWWYYGREHGQHVGLFRVETLQALAEATGKHLATDRYQHHLFTERPINGRRWRVSMRLSRYIAPVLTRRLESRTWSDHLLMSGTGPGTR